MAQKGKGDARLYRVEDGRLIDPFSDGEPEAAPLDDGATRHADGTWLRRDGGRLEPVAKAGSALAGLYDLTAEHGLSPDHPPATLGEAEAHRKDPKIDDPDLEDLRSLPFLTIDEPTSRDLDQALWVEPADHPGHLRIWYAIADASHFARPGSAVLAEALRRGSTYYLPGLVVPMLPLALSEDLASLGPDVDRRALVFDVELDADGEVVQSRLTRARVRSRLKTSYDRVQAYYDGAPPPGHDRLPKDLSRRLAAGLDDLRRAGERRIGRAEVRDTIRLRRRELAVRLAEDQLGFVGMGDPRNDAERFNEQISLLCNIVGARFLTRDDANLQPVFRFHQPPDGHRLGRFERETSSLVRRHRLDPEAWRWRRRRESLADYLARLPTDGPQGRIAQAIHRQAMLAGGRSGFDTAPGIHHGVGAEVYARFTAPMREVVGIYVHKETFEALGLERASDPAADEELRLEVLAAAERSRGLQRRLDGEVNRRLLDQMFRADLRSGGRAGRPGTILGVSRSKVHVQLDEPPVDVKVYLRHLGDGDGRLEQGRDRVTVRRRRGGEVVWTVGQAVRIRVVGEDRESDRWRLELLPGAAP